jgi:acyl-coenzyme A synthetase/AMP-(fatty) acid ligase
VPNPLRELSTYGDAPALLTTDRCVSYATLHADATALAAQIGAEPNLVFLEASNTVEAITAYVACLVGGHPVFLYSAQDRARALALAERYRPNAIFGADDSTEFALRRLHREKLALQPDLSVLLSTSGSTGSPKLVKLSTRNIRSNAEAIVEYLALDRTERAILGLKFSYSYGMSIVNSHLVCGGALVLTEDSILDDSFWTLFAQHQATSLAGVPYTFETLHRSEEHRYQASHLRYMTQAGGRLAPDLVRHFANTSAAAGRRFYVMYGQTEAAPRIAYLPPDKAATYPDCIGVAIPGGRIFLLDEAGREVEGCDQPGELAYGGPNIMLGYAASVDELATDETPTHLLTGDIACRNEAGLYYITGRRSRFVKPFGIRVNLDDVEARVRTAIPGAACTGVDERIVIVVPRSDAPADPSPTVRDLSAFYGLPLSAFQILVLESLPRLANGKVDFPSVASLAQDARASIHTTEARFPDRVIQALSIVSSAAFFRQVGAELLDLVGMRSGPVAGVAGIYSTLLPERTLTPDSTFTTLAGDSLTYVQASLAIEEYLGLLPPEWERMTIAELEQLHEAT